MPSDHDVQRAADLLRDGQLVAIPTETVYGLAADAFNAQAVAAIFQAKQRPHFDPLIVHIASLNMLEQVAAMHKLSDDAQQWFLRLIGAYWPGALTLILPRHNHVPTLVTAGLDTVAVRWPSHTVAQRIIERTGRPLAAPSANRFGRLSPTTADHVRKSLGDAMAVAMILDAGRCAAGIESTILDLSSTCPALLRHGAIPREQIEQTLGQALTDHTAASEHPSAPGQLKSHYAPQSPVMVVDDPMAAAMQAIAQGEAERVGVLLYRRPNNETTASEPQMVIRWLSDQGEPTQAAANLFAVLHQFDAQGVQRIYAPRIEAKGLNAAISDRLQRASHE